MQPSASYEPYSVEEIAILRNEFDASYKTIVERIADMDKEIEDLTEEIDEIMKDVAFSEKEYLDSEMQFKQSIEYARDLSERGLAAKGLIDSLVQQRKDLVTKLEEYKRKVSIMKEQMRKKVERLEVLRKKRKDLEKRQREEEDPMAALLGETVDGPPDTESEDEGQPKPKQAKKREGDGGEEGIDQSQRQIGSSGRFEVGTYRKPGRSVGRPPGESVSPATLLERMKMTHEAVTGREAPDYFDATTVGYIPFFFSNGGAIVPGGWKESSMLREARLGISYKGEDPRLVDGPPLSSSIVRMQNQVRQRGNTNLSGIVRTANQFIKLSNFS